MKVLLFLLTLSLGNVFKQWKREGGDLGKMLVDYIKKEPPYSDDYIMGLYLIDLISQIDSTERNTTYNALYSNLTGECLFSDRFPDKLKLLSIRCYLDTQKPEKAEGVLKKLGDGKAGCMSEYFIAKYYIEHGKQDKGKKYLEECIKNCRGVVAIWSRDLLFSEKSSIYRGR